MSWPAPGTLHQLLRQFAGLLAVAGQPDDRPVSGQRRRPQHLDGAPRHARPRAGRPNARGGAAGPGYSTGLVGKWHLGAADGARPADRGFTESFGHLGGAFDFYSHLIWGAANREVVRNGKKGIGFLVHDLWENGAEVWRDGEYATEMFGERAVQFVRKAARRDDPFFLYLAFNAPHHPMHAPEKYKERFPDLKWDRQIMAAMISAMDDQIGSSWTNWSGRASATTPSSCS